MYWTPWTRNDELNMSSCAQQRAGKYGNASESVKIFTIFCHILRRWLSSLSSFLCDKVYRIYIVFCDCHCLSFVSFVSISFLLIHEWIWMNDCIYKKVYFGSFSTLLQDDIFEAFSEYGDIKNLYHGCKEFFFANALSSFLTNSEEHVSCLLSISKVHF